MIDPELIETITRTIVSSLHPNRVLMFGSRARNDNGADSDIDLFVEMETEKSPPERAIQVASLFGLHSWSLDVVVYTPAEVRKFREIQGSFISTIEKEGQILYELS